MNNRPVKILILNHENEDSKPIRDRLISPPGVEIEVEEKKDNPDSTQTAALIKAGNYDLVLVNENAAGSIFKLICQDKEFSQGKPIFYIGGTVETYLDREIKGIEFSGVVAVAKDGKIILNKAYGEANRENKQLNTPDTQFNIASIMKSMTALGVIRLVEDELKKQHIDKDNIYKTPIRDLLPSNHPYAKYFKDFTLHELLTHTSGLSDSLLFEPYFGGKEVNFSEAKDFVTHSSELFQEQKLENRGQFRYCNYNYFLLGIAIEALSGKNYYEFIRDQILLPAGMTHTQPQRSSPSAAVAYPSDSKLSFETIPSWLSDMTMDDKDAKLNGIAVNSCKLLGKVQSLIKENPAYTYVRKLQVEYAEKLKTTDEKGYAALRTEFKDKLDKGYAMLCSKDDAGHFFIKPELLELKQALDQNFFALARWLRENPESSANAQKLRSLLEAAHDSFIFPMEVLGSIQVNLSIGHPAGCWFSTADDLVKLHAAMFNEHGALNKYAKIAVSPVMTMPAGSDDNYRYGICTGVHGTGHSGSAAGVDTKAFTFREQNTSIITLSNERSFDHSSPKMALFRDLEYLLVNGPVRYLDTSMTPQEKLLADIVEIHQRNNPDSSLRMG